MLLSLFKAIVILSLTIICTSTIYEDLNKLNKKLSLCNNINIQELTIKKAHDLLIKNKLTTTQLTKCYINRIKTMDPMLNSVIEVNPDAIIIAENLDYKFQLNKKLIGPLHGIPILIKENINTEDKLNTTAGSFALLGNKVKYDAKVIYKLRKAGAIVIGKSNLSEFAGMLSLESPEGFSARGNQTINPYHVNFPTSGSSSGSAVAVASNFALVSLGTQTLGSIVRPASVTSTYGYKPTFGGVSSYGVIPVANSLDTVGVISRSIVDGLMVSKVIVNSNLKPKLDKINLFKFDYSTNIIRRGVDVKVMKIYKFDF